MTVAFKEGLESLKRELVLDAADDYIDLSWVIHDVREAFGVTDDTELMFHTVAVLHALLDDGLLRAGVPTREGGFEPWQEDTGAVVDRIISEWRELGRTPNLWEVVWLDATEAGEAYAERVGAET